MTYYCLKGDIKMCRYLLTKGAPTTETWYKTGDAVLSPMMAACMGGSLEICQLLCENGGLVDIGKENDLLHCPLYMASRGESSQVRRERVILHQEYKDICRFLILNGALSGDHRSIDERIRKILYQNPAITM